MDTPRVENGAGAQSFFAPRRLGHANLFVNDYENAFEFYNRIVGFHEVYRQPDNMASFVSNGCTYHDLALTDSRSRYASKDQKPGLWHLAFEVETELELVDGYRNAVDSGVNFAFTMDHDAAHSLYLHDPDGNVVELYADIVSDWWTVRHGIIVKEKPEWIPGVTAPPVAEPKYPVNPEIRIVEGAVFRPKRTSHVGLVSANFENMLTYYTEVVGLSAFAVDVKRQFAVLSGTVGASGLTLFAAREGLEPGLHNVGFPVWDEADLDRAVAALKDSGVTVEREIEHAARRSITIRDPDGLLLQFYVDREWTPALVATVAIQDAPHLL